MRRKERAQALVETCIFLPLFLLSLYAMIWIVRAGVLANRAQLGVRYAGTIGVDQQPVTETSLYAMTNSVAASAVPTPDFCATPIPNAFGQDGPYAGRSPVMWQPNSSATPIATCTMTRAQYPTGVANAHLFLNQNTTSLSITENAPGYLNSAVGAQKNITSRVIFYTMPSFASIVHCYPDMVNFVGRSLKINGEIGSAYVDDQIPLQWENAQGTTALPNNPSVGSLAFDGGCARTMDAAPGLVPPESLWTPLSLPWNSINYNDHVPVDWPSPAGPGQITATPIPGTGQPTGTPGTMPGPTDVGPVFQPAPITL